MLCFTSYVPAEQHICPKDKIEFIVGESEYQKKKKQETKKESPAFLNANVEIISESNENCVEYAKRISGIQRTMGGGARLAIQGTKPITGAIGSEKKYIHAFVVERVIQGGVVATEANYVKGHINRRFIPNDDILGYVYY